MNEMDMTPDIYTLIDEEGNEQAFELLDVMDLEDQRSFCTYPPILKTGRVAGRRWRPGHFEIRNG